MLWNNQSQEPEKATPWVIGIFGLIVFAIATYINYADSWFPHRTATDISASSPSKSE